MRRVEAANIEGGIRLGIALGLRFLQHIVEAPTLLQHLGQDVIASAVEDAIDAGDVVAEQALAHHLHHGDAAGDRGLEVQRHAMFLGKSGKTRAVMGKQRLIGGDDMLAGFECCLDGLLGDALLAADQLDEDVDLRIFAPG